MSHVAQEKDIQYIRPLWLDERYRWTSSGKYTLVIYESLDCKFCRKLSLEIEKYKSKFEGKFNLAYRNAPLVNLEPYAFEKAMISECIYRESWSDQMFAYIESIYGDYQVFQKNNDWAKDRAKKFIKNPENLDTCMRDPSTKQKIDNDLLWLFVDGISSTPSIGIFYDGRLVGRYASWFDGTMWVMEYLATFDQNADQFWSDELYKSIQKKR